MTDDILVRTAVDASVLTVTLDSPANRNALSSALVAQLQTAFDAATDEEIRAVVLTHTGGTFCAGADLGEALKRGLSPEEATAEGGRAMVGLIRTVLELDKPVIVVADGHVRAGGLGLVGAADIALAGPAATFALTESRLGLAASIISIPLLAKMSARAAGRYFLTGEKFGADTAAGIGLVTAACATDDDLAAELDSVLEGIRKASPQGLSVSKKLTTAALLDGFDVQAQARAEESMRLFASDEAREGMTAFLSKRRPEWDTSR
ncbi:MULTISPECIES: enoyl-CoA hydratase family protein [Gordonia]|uniref:Putative enoyl-CoA hydratase n=1 Tax=Gordonia sihwensis NBRC 108236 TaxID=1223544 RepID=L7LED8_9ACTN|nr:MULTISPECIES: enoyl-CoA hydratase family protein [Gordonia]AUH69923.1 enoyl-CoA hydratase [Gordonia sp. YC-JH1]MBY4569974.1 enoyl-CoA hydratase [Gordonia sihwensis]WFN93409.1 enoyl-CoA hydratase family protein [Gordonia sihwensis]GAC59274.1 putative enoyl-CoA hydratase [Gordonia sihwensis NBRC 108236]